jgi:hypothetical protein
MQFHFASGWVSPKPTPNRLSNMNRSGMSVITGAVWLCMPTQRRGAVQKAAIAVNQLMGRQFVP